MDFNLDYSLYISMFLMYSCLFLIMIYRITRTQLLHANIDEVWEFASSPSNLKKITPDYMNFNIISPDLPKKIYPGMIINYIVSPIYKPGNFFELQKIDDLAKKLGISVKK